MMRVTRAKTIRLGLRALGLAALLGAGVSAWAQDDVEPDAPAAAAVGVQVRFGGIAEQNFDAWVFSPLGNAAAARSNFERRLRLHLEEVDRACHLSEAQKQKLRLAARGDVEHFFDRVELARIKFRALKDDQQKLNEIWQDIGPLQIKFNSGLFNEDSLFRKSLGRTLNAEQAAQYQKVEDEHSAFRYQAAIASTLQTLEESVPLEDEQRQKLLQIIRAETRPPRKFGQYDYYVVMYQLAKLPEDRLKPLFDDAQWRIIKRHFNEGRNMKQLLKSNGVLPIEPDDATGYALPVPVKVVE